MNAPVTGRLARLPLRTQLVALLLLSVVLVVLVTSLAGTVALRSYLVDRIDDELVQVVQQPPRDLRGDGPGRGREARCLGRAAADRLRIDRRPKSKTGVPLRAPFGASANAVRR